MKRFFLICLVLFLQLNNLGAAVIYVDATAAGNNDGSSWSNAFNSLTAALEEANSRNSEDSLLIAGGTYYPTVQQLSSDRTATFGIFRGGIRLYGGYPAGGGDRDKELYPVILDGAIGGAGAEDNSYHVMVIAGIAANADSIVVDGLLIRNGSGDINTPDTLNGAPLKRSYGAGMAIVNVGNGGKTSIRFCKLEKNRVTSTIVPMTPPWPGGPDGYIDFGYGAGAYVYNSAPYIFNCVFSKNLAEGCPGGGLSLTEDKSVISNCTFEDNLSGNGGTGAQCLYESKAVFRNSIFTGNDSHVEGGGSSALASDEGRNNEVTAVNCLFYKNKGIAIDGCVRQIINCTIAGNYVGYLNGAAQAGPVLFANCIFFDNEIRNITSPEDSLTVTHCLIAGRQGNNNVSGNPHFANAANNDYRLLSQSPAINAGENSFLPADAVTDLGGLSRIAEMVVDIGAYEYPSTTGITANAALQNSIVVYPNPVQDILHIDADEPLNAFIYSIDGKLYLQQNKASAVSLRSILPGIYFVSLYNQDGRFLASRQFLKEK